MVWKSRKHYLMLAWCFNYWTIIWRTQTLQSNEGIAPVPQPGGIIKLELSLKAIRGAQAKQRRRKREKHWLQKLLASEATHPCKRKKRIPIWSLGARICCSEPTTCYSSHREVDNNSRLFLGASSSTHHENHKLSTSITPSLPLSLAP